MQKPESGASQAAHQTPLFPADFLWGVSTSAYQIEGATQEDGRGASIWDTFVATPGTIFQGQTAEVAADHYHRYQEDVALMAELGLNAYRFSLAWPRILPEGTGAVNQRGLDFYDRLVDALLEKDIQPLATLYHWDLPLPLYQRGGWLSRETAYAFADYAEVVARRLGDRVKWWLTHNEPWCSAFLGYGVGIHAPGVRDVQSACVVAHHVLLSHGLALPRMRVHAQPNAQMGIALNLYPIYPADDTPETQAAAARADAFCNRWFLDPLYQAKYPEGFFADLGVAGPTIEAGDLATIAAPTDFLGVNYYSRKVVRALPPGASKDPFAPGGYEEVVVPGAAYTQMGPGWEIYPQGLRDVLARVHREYQPGQMLVTENGAAFEDKWNGDGRVPDLERAEYLRQHLEAMGQALAQGVPLGGYFLWSLLDNFEWAEGYSKRFGIVYVDYQTQRRVVKDSGHWYADFIARHSSHA
jgi:beta-glucosidase